MQIIVNNTFDTRTKRESIAHYYHFTILLLFANPQHTTVGS